MQALQLLAAQAIVGTERQPPALPAVPGAIGETLAALDQTDPAASLLRAAGVLSVCALAGQVLAPATMHTFAPCPPEPLPQSEDTRLAELFETLFADAPLRVQIEALRLLAAGYLPYRTLPKALDLGRQTRVIRPYLFPVLGQRGQWLARLNPNWAYAVGDENSEIAWETGSLDQRLLYLRLARQTDPAHARELLAQSLPECGAKERAALLAVLETGLNAEDEDLLESLLKDRGKEVRAAAAGLLARLPQSRFVGRMAGRVSACLSHGDSGLILTAPETFGTDWKADTLEEAVPTGQRFGQRAWWLYQLTCLLPLSWWVEASGFSPKQLTDWAKQGEWQYALMSGWLEVHSHSPDPAWAEAFLPHLPDPRFSVDPFAMALTLPPLEREQYWLNLLQQTPPLVGFGGLLRQLLLALPADTACISAGFARLVFAQIAAYSQSANATKDYYLRETLSDFAALLPSDTFDEARALWASIPAQVPSYGSACNRFPAILELRERLYSHSLLKEPKP